MPSYTRGQPRDQLTFVKVTTGGLYYGFNTKDFASLPGARITAVDMVALGHLLPTQVPEGAIRIVGANSPKPPRMKKVINQNPTVTQQGSASTFCGIDNIKTAEDEGWRFVNGGRQVNLTNSDRTKTLAVDLGGGVYYLFPMNAADADKYADILGLQLPSVISQSERARAFSGASRPRPARVKKTTGDDKGFSSFCSEDKLDDVLADGFSLVKPAVKYS